MNDPGSLARKRRPLWMYGRKAAVDVNIWTAHELLFYFAFFMFVLKYTCDYSSLISRNEMLNSLLAGLCVAASVIKIVLQRYTILRLALTFALCAVIGYSSYISVNNLFLYGFLLIMASQDIELEKLVKVSFYTKIVSIVFHVLIYIAVFLTDQGAVRFVFRGGGSNIPRHFFFMGHANTFSAFLLWTCVDYIYINYKKLNVFHLAVIWIINLVFYAFTYTNSALMLLTTVTVFIALDKLGKGVFDRLITAIARYGYTVFAALSAFLTAIYAGLDSSLRNMWDALDSFMTGRLWYGAYAYDLYGPTFFGRKFSGIPRKIFWQNRWQDAFHTFDSYYLGNLYVYGIINLVLTGIALIVLCRKMETREKIIIIAFSIYAISEAYVTNVVVCFALFIIGKYIYSGVRVNAAEQSKGKQLKSQEA